MLAFPGDQNRLNSGLTSTAAGLLIAALTVVGWTGPSWADTAASIPKATVVDGTVVEATAVERTLAEAPVAPMETPADLGVLPTMKGHMGRLGTLMNIVFRSMRRPDGGPEALAAIEEMRLHLRRSGDTLIPDKVAAIEDPTERTVAIAEYKECMDQTIARLDDLADLLRVSPPKEAYDTLLALDRQRRDCHSKYARGPAAPIQVASAPLRRSWT
ncbi:MAG: hypothetical protein AAF909_05285 [Pseudomonadota bacterium]